MLSENEQFDYDKLGNRQTYTQRNGSEVSYSHNTANEYILIGSPVAQWKLNDNTTSADVLDSSGNSYTGTAKRNGSNRDSDQFHVSGLIDGAFTFDGSQKDYVDSNVTKTDLGLGNTRSYSAWIKTSTAQTYGSIVGNFKYVSSSESYGISVGFNGGTGLRIYVGDNNGLYNYADYTVNYYDGYWHHVALTWDGDTATMYYDGESIQTLSSALVASDADFVFGRWTESYNAYWYTGDIDDVRIYNRLLTDIEVAGLYAAGADYGSEDDLVAYDAAGNLSRDSAGYEYAYDHDNRLTKVRKSNDTVDVASYTYDALGRRIEFVDHVGSTTTRYYYDGWRVLTETNDSDSPQRDYIYGNYIDEVLVMVDVVANPDEDYNYAHDHLFSVVAVLDDTGAVVEHYEYDAYGKVDVLTDPGTGTWWDGDEDHDVKSGLGNPYTFTGQREDSLDGSDKELYYYKERCYDSVTGRFLQRDRLGVQEEIGLYYFEMEGTSVWDNFAFVSLSKQYEFGLNIYEYVSSIPIEDLDPYGLARKPRGMREADRKKIKCKKIKKKWKKEINERIPDFVLDAPNWAFFGRNMPHRHCVWNCMMTKNRGSEYAKRMSKLKEELDELHARYGLELKSSGCWDSLSKREQDFIGANARSAWQNADLKDNATGRNCGRACVVKERYVPAPMGPGYWHREYHDRNSGSVKHSLANHCRECCARNGVPPDAVEGPGTDRPYGPYGDDFPTGE